MKRKRPEGGGGERRREGSALGFRSSSRRRGEFPLQFSISRGQRPLNGRIKNSNGPPKRVVLRYRLSHLV